MSAYKYPSEYFIVGKCKLEKACEKGSGSPCGCGRRMKLSTARNLQCITKRERDDPALSAASFFSRRPRRARILSSECPTRPRPSERYDNLPLCKLTTVDESALGLSGLHSFPASPGHTQHTCCRTNTLYSVFIPRLLCTAHLFFPRFPS